MEPSGRCFPKPGDCESTQRIRFPGNRNSDRDRTPMEMSDLEAIMNDFTDQLRAHHINVNTPDYAAPGGHWNYHRLQPELQAWWAASQVKDCTLFILSRKNFQRYPAIKRSADFAGYHSLCAVGSKIARDDGRNDKTGSRWQHFSNLALKLNMKMGGDNHWLEPNALNKAFGSQEGKRSTMVMGS
jgi:hypothetical protein